MGLPSRKDLELHDQGQEACTFSSKVTGRRGPPSPPFTLSESSSGCLNLNSIDVWG